MSAGATATHPGLARLLAWWFADGGEAEQAGIGEHVLGCTACSAVLDAVAALGEQVRGLSSAGAVQAVVSGGFVRRLAAGGVRVREYRVAHNGSVECSVGAADQVLVARLEAPLAGVQRLDLVADDVQGRGAVRWDDIPFDAARGEVVFTPRIDDVRRLPAQTSRVRLLARDAPGVERLVGEYVFRHSPLAGE